MINYLINNCRFTERLSFIAESNLQKRVLAVALVILGCLAALYYYFRSTVSTKTFSEIKSTDKELFSAEIIKQFPLFKTFYTTNVNLETRADFKPLIKFFKTLKFEPAINFDSVSSYELLMHAMVVGGGTFESKEPLVQIRMLEMLNPIVEKLYHDKTLPLPLRKALKEDFIHRFACLFDNSHAYLKDKIGLDGFAKGSNLNYKLQTDDKLISANELLEPLLKATINDKIAKDCVIKFFSKRISNGPADFSYKVGGLGYEMKFSAEIIEDLYKTVITRSESVITVKGLKWFQNYMRTLYLKDKEAFKERFIKVFPDSSMKNFELEKEQWSISEDPTLFEIPLLSEEAKVTVHVYIWEENGQLTKQTFGSDVYDKEISIALDKNYMRFSGYILS